MDNSYKYGDQIQFTVYNVSGSTIKAERVPYARKYDRMEIFMNKEDFVSMCKQALEQMKPTTMKTRYDRPTDGD
jgi:hypothetical protein